MDLFDILIFLEKRWHSFSLQRIHGKFLKKVKIIENPYVMDENDTNLKKTIVYEDSEYGGN